MDIIFPKKLKTGDEIRVIAPSRSLSIISEEIKKLAEERLNGMGFKVSYSKNAREKDDFASSSIESRVSDLHEAFLDNNVAGILTAIGGFNVNQILDYLDYGLIESNPKVLCGFSDITALGNAIHKKTGLVTYSGPHFSTFGMAKGIDYTIENFRKCLMREEPFEINPSDEWSDDAWYADQEKREFIKNEGFWTINGGKAEGRIVGGNQCTLNLLQGTEFMPDMEDGILFLEDDDEAHVATIDRDLQSIIHQPGFEKVRAIVFGRLQRATGMTEKLLTQIVKSKKELDNMPIIYGADFGHTTPHMTFPIGGTAKLEVEDDGARLEIIKH